MHRHLPTLLLMLLLAACQREAPPSAPQTSSATAAASLTVDGSAFVLTLPDGRVLRGAELVGSVVHVAVPGDAVAAMKIASVTPDPEDPRILRHELLTADGQGGWKNACTPNRAGEAWALPLALPAGHPGRDGEITISCISGVVAKCVRWGYPPWASGPAGESLALFHASCVRMARADYCGDGAPHTKEGTSIDNYDDLGIQKRGAADDPSYVFEAGWAPQGAVCVARTRWPDVVTLDALKAQCPRLAAVPYCDEISARALGARMFNHSQVQASAAGAET